MEQRDRLIELLKVPIYPHLDADPAEVVADYLLDNGVIVPTADVVEVQHGKWIEADGTRKGQKFMCSVCKGVSYYPQPTRAKNWVKHCGYSNCPYCLAKMDGKDGAE